MEPTLQCVQPVLMSGSQVRLARVLAIPKRDGSEHYIAQLVALEQRTDPAAIYLN